MRYVPAEELEAARAAEPVAAYRSRLIEEGVLDEADATEAERLAKEEVEAAFVAALAAEPPDPDEAAIDIYQVRERSRRRRARSRPDASCRRCRE